MPKRKTLDPLLLPAWEHFQWLIEKIPPLSPKPDERLVLAVFQQMQKDLWNGKVEPVIAYFEDILADLPDTGKEKDTFKKARRELFRKEYTAILEALRAYHDRKILKRPPH